MVIPPSEANRWRKYRRGTVEMNSKACSNEGGHVAAQFFEI